MNGKTEILALIRRVFSITTRTNEALLQETVSEAFSFKTFFITACPTTSREDWDAKNFAVHVTEDGVLPIFLTMEDATFYTGMIGAIHAGSIPMAMAVSRTKLSKLVQNYMRKDFINAVRLYVRLPLYLDASPNYFLTGAPISSPSMVMTVDDSSLDCTAPTELHPTLNLIPEIKKVLDLSEASARRQLDASNQYGNLHSLIEKVVSANGLNVESLDQQLELPQGFIRNFCTNRVSGAMSKETALKILSYFGLEEYQYQFKGSCEEIAREIKQEGQIDCYDVRPAKIATKERFKLTRIGRGKDKNGAYVYGMTFVSKSRTVKAILSTPFGFSVGKEYELKNLKPVMDESGERGGLAPVHIPSPDELVAALEKVKDPPEKTRVINERVDSPKIKAASVVDIPEEILSPEEKDELILYFKQREGCNSRDAEKMLAPLVAEPDLLKEFHASVVHHKKTGAIKIGNYDAQALTNKLRFSPYEAYLQLINLRRKPKETAIFLKYRESDPQYQKPSLKKPSE